MVRADLFSGSLAVWNFRGGAAFARPPHSEPRKARRGEKQVRAIFRIPSPIRIFKRLEAAERRAETKYEANNSLKNPDWRYLLDKIRTYFEQNPDTDF